MENLVNNEINVFPEDPSSSHVHIPASPVTSQGVQELRKNILDVVSKIPVKSPVNIPEELSQQHSELPENIPDESSKQYTESPENIPDELSKQCTKSPENILDVLSKIPVGSPMNMFEELSQQHTESPEIIPDELVKKPKVQKGEKKKKIGVLEKIRLERLAYYQKRLEQEEKKLRYMKERNKMLKKFYAMTD